MPRRFAALPALNNNCTIARQSKDRSSNDARQWEHNKRSRYLRSHRKSPKSYSMRNLHADVMPTMLSRPHNRCARRTFTVEKNGHCQVIGRYVRPLNSTTVEFKQVKERSLTKVFCLSSQVHRPFGRKHASRPGNLHVGVHILGCLTSSRLLHFSGSEPRTRQHRRRPHEPPGQIRPTRLSP